MHQRLASDFEPLDHSSSIHDADDLAQLEPMDDEPSTVHINVDDLSTMEDLQLVAEVADMSRSLLSESELWNLESRAVPCLVTNAWEESDDEERFVPRSVSEYGGDLMMVD